MKRTGQHAIITGGSSGIGRAIALQLAEQGANLSILARRPTLLQEAEADIRQAFVAPQQRVVALGADVSDRAQAEQAIQEAIARQGPPDLLITCAGIARPGYFQEIPLEVFELTMAINYFGSLYCIRAALPAMEQQGSGHITLVSSGAGLVGIFGYSPYSPSKFALRGLAESIRGELKPMGIGVSIVYPPDTDTPQLAEESKTKPPETQQITATADLWQPEAIAREILSGIERGKFAIAPGFEMGVLSRFHSLIAAPLNHYFDRIVTQHRRSK